ncbi:MAG: hypothetical protein V4596_08520 [Bdellovibrionota bacterium]
MLKVLSIALLAFTFSNTVHAEDLNSPYFQIKSHSITEVPVDASTMKNLRSNQELLKIRRAQGEKDGLDDVLGDILNPVKEVDATLDVIINMGAKIWKIFEASTPVVNLSTKRANAIPREATDWRDMADWSDVQARQYSVSYKNAFNSEVVRFSVLMTYTYNGTHKGKGKYLSDVGFLVNEYWVAPLYKLEGESEVVRVQNVGRADAPIAAMELNMVWRVSTVLVKSQNAINYYVRGDGPLTVREL